MRPTKNKGSLWIFQAQPKHSRNKVRVHCGPVGRALGRDTNAPCEMCISLECQLACAGSVLVCEQLSSTYLGLGSFEHLRVVRRVYSAQRRTYHRKGRES